jgi:hypothetical protein
VQKVQRAPSHEENVWLLFRRVPPDLQIDFKSTQINKAKPKQSQSQGG